jgi:hypothetical protein
LGNIALISIATIAFVPVLGDGVKQLSKLKYVDEVSDVVSGVAKYGDDVFDGLVDSGKPLYRYMSGEELKDIQNTGLLRGGINGPTYWTDASFKSAENAADKLSLLNTPQYRMEFNIINSPEIHGGSSVAPDFSKVGGGREYWSFDPVQVQIVNVQPIGVR